MHLLAGKIGQKHAVQADRLAYLTGNFRLENINAANRAQERGLQNARTVVRQVHLQPAAFNALQSGNRRGNVGYGVRFIPRAPARVRFTAAGRRVCRRRASRDILRSLSRITSPGARLAQKASQLPPLPAGNYIRRAVPERHETFGRRPVTAASLAASDIIADLFCHPKRVGDSLLCADVADFSAPANHAAADSRARIAGRTITTNNPNGLRDRRAGVRRFSGTVADARCNGAGFRQPLRGDSP